MRTRPALITGLVICLAALTATSTPAQTCVAAPSLRTTGYRAGVGGGLGHHEKVFSVRGATAVPGSPLYAAARIGILRRDDLGANAVTGALTVGLEAPVDETHRSGVCPFVGLGAQDGPHNIRNTGLDYKDLELSAGLAIGREIQHWESGSIAIALEGLYRRVFFRYDSATFWLTDNEGQSALTLTLSMATGRVLLQISLSQPANLNLSPTSFGFGIAVMGPPKRRPAR
jgi:hypothetical protein